VDLLITDFIADLSQLSYCVKRMMQLPAGLCVAQPCRYWFYSLGQKWVIHPAGVTRCPDKHESWHRGADHANFHVYSGKNVGIQPPKLSKFRTLARNLYLRSDCL